MPPIPVLLWVCQVHINQLLPHHTTHPPAVCQQGEVWSHNSHWLGANTDSLVQDCSNSSALAMELLQSCTKSAMDSLCASLFLSSCESAKCRLISCYLTIPPIPPSVCQQGDVWSQDSHWLGANTDSLVQECSNSSALALELLQSCTKPSTWSLNFGVYAPHSCPAMSLPTAD